MVLDVANSYCNAQFAICSSLHVLLHRGDVQERVRRVWRKMDPFYFNVFRPYFFDAASHLVGRFLLLFLCGIVCANARWRTLRLFGGPLAILFDVVPMRAPNPQEFDLGDIDHNR